MPHPLWKRGDRRSVVITGGGTAGHVFPAIVVGRALVNEGYLKENINFVGSRRGMEGRLVPEAGFVITLLGGRGIVRRLSLANIPAIIGLFGAFLHSLILVARLRPSAIVTVGGYASVPFSFAGALFRVPIVVVNVDAVPGLANRLTGRIARFSAVAFAGTPLARSVVTGAPVRAEIERVGHSDDDRRKARIDLGIGDKDGQRLVVITGGSLGARRLNEVGCELAERVVDRADLFIYHVVGERNTQSIEQFAQTHELGTNYRYVAFESRMAELLAAADLVIGRSGAMMVAELAIIGAPSVLVPLPGAPNDHQTKNARALADAGAAIIIPDDELTVERLYASITALLTDTDRLSTMSDAARSLGKRDAGRAIARLVDNVVSNARRGSTNPAGN